MRFESTKAARYLFFRALAKLAMGYVDPEVRPHRTVSVTCVNRPQETQVSVLKRTGAQSVGQSKQIHRRKPLKVVQEPDV